MSSSIHAAASIPTHGQKSLFYPITTFHKAVNGDCPDCGWLSLAKRVLNIAFPLIIALNFVMLPFIAIWNCCQSSEEQKPALKAAPVEIKETESIAQAASTVLPQQNPAPSDVVVTHSSATTTPTTDVNTISTAEEIELSDDDEEAVVHADETEEEVELSDDDEEEMVSADSAETIVLEVEHNQSKEIKPTAPKSFAACMLGWL